MIDVAISRVKDCNDLQVILLCVNILVLMKKINFVGYCKCVFMYLYCIYLVDLFE